MENSDKKKLKNKLIARIWLTLSAVLFLYGIMVMSLGTGTGFFAVWIAGAVLAVLLSFAARKSLWSGLPGGLRKVLICLVCLGTAFFLFIEACILSGFDEKGREDLDYVIVLGAQVYDSGPSRVLRFRLDCAADYLNASPRTICIVSGGQGYNEPRTEAEVMAEYLEEKGIERDRIILEDTSRTTAENIRNTMPMIKEGSSVGLITNNFHVFRAVQTAEHNGMEDICGIAAGSTAFYLPNNLLREFFGECKFLLSCL